MALTPRDVTGDITNVSSTFSSFAKCMDKDYCKIPFIVICIVVGLSILSTLWCFFRCCLCGYHCCACCCGGCGGRRASQGKRSGGEISESATPIVQQPPRHEPPRYAYFDSQNDDALPIMPSLEKAHHIVVSVEQGHELALMRTTNTHDPPSSQRYEQDQPLQDLQYPNRIYPSSVRGYGQEAYRTRMSPFNDSFNTVPPTSPAPPPHFNGTGYQANGMVHHGSIGGYLESSSHLQDPEHDWDGQYAKAHDDYQGSRQHQHRDISNYNDQQRQQEWVIV